MRLWASPKTRTRTLQHVHTTTSAHSFTRSRISAQAQCLPSTWAIGTFTYRVASEKLMNMKKLLNEQKKTKKPLSFLCSSCSTCLSCTGILVAFFIKVLWLWPRLLTILLCLSVFQSWVAGSHTWNKNMYECGIIGKETLTHTYRFSWKFYSH